MATNSVMDPADMGPNATDAPEDPVTWLKKKLEEDDAGAHSSSIASNAGRQAQSTDAQNQY